MDNKLSASVKRVIIIIRMTLRYVLNFILNSKITICGDDIEICLTTKIVTHNSRIENFDQKNDDKKKIGKNLRKNRYIWRYLYI